MAMKGSVTTWFTWLIRWKDSTWEDRRCRLTSKPSRRSGSWRCGTFWRHKCNKCNKCNKCDKCDKCDNEKKNFVQPRECAPLVNTKRYLTQSWIIFNICCFDFFSELNSAGDRSQREPFGPPSQSLGQRPFAAFSLRPSAHRAFLLEVETWLKHMVKHGWVTWLWKRWLKHVNNLQRKLVEERKENMCSRYASDIPWCFLDDFLNISHIGEISFSYAVVLLSFIFFRCDFYVRLLLESHSNYCIRFMMVHGCRFVLVEKDHGWRISKWSKHVECDSFLRCFESVLSHFVESIFERWFFLIGSILMKMSFWFLSIFRNFESAFGWCTALRCTKERSWRTTPGRARTSFSGSKDEQIWAKMS